MNKLFICASVAGLAAGVAFWLHKKGKSYSIMTGTVDEKAEAEAEAKSEPHEDNFSQNTQNTQHTTNTQNANAMEEMYQAKSESAQTIFERHSEAASIMKDAYADIMEDFVEDFSGEADANPKDNKEVAVDGEFISVMNENDLISDELDDFLE